MCRRYPGEDPQTDLLERRWFAASRAAAEIQAECDALSQVLDMTRTAWRDARTRLAALEALRDAMDNELAIIHEHAELDSSTIVQRSAA